MSDVIALIERIEADLARLRRLVAEEPALRYTGCRRTRGTHGSGHVRDPLGTDVPPADWPHPRPTPAEIRAAERTRAAAA